MPEVHSGLSREEHPGIHEPKLRRRGSVLSEQESPLTDVRQMIIQETNYMNLISKHDDRWNSHWIRRAKSKMKLYQFFGQHAPLDVRFEDIADHGLTAMLQSTVPMCYFFYSLLDQHSFENLLFFLEVDQFQGHEFADNDEMQGAAIEIFRAFLQRNSEFEVNVDGNIKRTVKREIRQCKEKCFMAAKDHVQSLMEPCFIAFLNSPVWNVMEKDLKGQVVPYLPEVRERALSVLIGFLDERMPLRQPPGVKITRAQLRRNKIIREIIHTFARTRMNLDFKDLSPEMEEEMRRKGINAYDEEEDLVDATDDPGVQEDYMKIVEALSKKRASDSRAGSVIPDIPCSPKERMYGCPTQKKLTMNLDHLALIFGKSLRFKKQTKQLKKECDYLSSLEMGNPEEFPDELAKNPKYSRHLDWTIGATDTGNMPLWDASLQELENGNLDTILEGHVTLIYFVRILLELDIFHCLLFYFEGKAFRTVKFPGDDHVRDAIRKIYLAYFHQKGKFYIPIDKAARKAIKRGYRNADVHAFDLALKWVKERPLQAAYKHFRNSFTWRLMALEIKYEVIPYRPELQLASIVHVMEYLDAHYPSLQPPGKMISMKLKKEHLVMRELVIMFIRLYMGYEIHKHPIHIQRIIRQRGGNPDDDVPLEWDTNPEEPDEEINEGRMFAMLTNNILTKRSAPATS